MSLGTVGGQALGARASRKRKFLHELLPDVLHWLLHMMSVCQVIVERVGKARGPASNRVEQRHDQD